MPLTKLNAPLQAGPARRGPIDAFPVNVWARSETGVKIGPRVPR